MAGVRRPKECAHRQPEGAIGASIGNKAPEEARRPW